MKRNAAAALLVLLALTAAFSIRAQDDPPPYLYYYSQLLGGIVIERADGSDSRVIGQDAFPPDLDGIVGPGWSPSGRYFAASHFRAGATFRPGTPRVIDRSGRNIFLWFEWLQVAEMQWSSTGDDLLFVAGSLVSGGTISYWVIDVAKEKLLAEFAVNFLGFYGQIPELRWDPDKQLVQFRLYSEPFPINTEYSLITMYFDGRIVKEPLTRLQWHTMNSDEPIVDTAKDSIPEHLLVFRGIGVSPSGRYSISRVDHSFVLLENETGRTVTLPEHTQATVCRSYVWTADERYIISLSGTLLAGGGCALAVLGVTDNKARFWRELGTCWWDIDTCTNWLPAHVDVAALPPGAPSPVQLEPRWIEYEEDTVYGVTVNDLENPRLFCRANLTMDIVDGETLNTKYAHLSGDCPYSSVDDFAGRGFEITAVYNSTYDLLATYFDYLSDNAVSLWTRHGDVYERILRVGSQGHILEFTDDGQHLRARNVNGWKIYAVADILAAADRLNTDD